MDEAWDQVLQLEAAVEALPWGLPLVVAELGEIALQVHWASVRGKCRAGRC